MLIPATITVNFTANYAGPHRICWRQCSVGAFVCTNVVDCLGGGNVCSATVSIMVDPESCVPVCFEGYIQATCNPEGSPVDQVPWSATFTPTPSCTQYNISCTDPMGCGVIPAVTMGLNCNGTARPDVGPLPNVGAGLNICAQSVIPNLPAGYVMTKNGATCCTCTTYAIEINPSCPFPLNCVLDGTTLYWTDCVTKELKSQVFTGTLGVDIVKCAITGTVQLVLGPEALGTVTAQGPC
jgi:hypothetical protein